MLIFQELQPASEETNANVPIAQQISKELDALGKVSPVVYDPSSRLFQMALRAGTIKEAPAEPTRDQVFEIGRALQCRYVLIVKAYSVGAQVHTVATLYRLGGRGPIWGPEEKDYSAERGGVTDFDTAAATAARTLALRLASGPLEHEDTEPVLPPTDPGTGTGDTTPPAPPENRPYGEGLKAFETGEYEEAAALLRGAVDQDPLNGAIRAKLAETYVALNLPDLALTEVIRSLKLIPGSRDLVNMHGRVLVATGQLRDAEVVYRTLLAREPENFDATAGLAEVLAARAMPDEAAKYYRQARKLQPENAEIAWALSEVLAMQGDFEGSLKERDAALALGLPTDDKAALERYRRVMSIVASFGAQAADDLQAVHTEAARAGTSDFDLNARIADVLVRVNGLIGYLEQLKPPAVHAESHSRRLFGMNLLSQAVVAVKRAVQQDKPDALEEASVTRTEALRELDSAQKLYEKERAAESSGS